MMHIVALLIYYRNWQRHVEIYVGSGICKVNTDSCNKFESFGVDCFLCQ